MEKKELIEISKKLGMNQEAVANQFKEDPKLAEKQIVEPAKFMGLIK